MPRYTAGFKVYTDPTEKRKLYGALLRVADERFEEWRAEAEDAIRRYRNELLVTQLTPTGHRINAPVGVGVIDALYSALTAVKVEFEARPTGTARRQEAMLATAGINDVWREQKVARKVEKAVKDALLVGIGWVKVDYEYAETEVEQPRSGEDVAAEVDRLFAAAASAGVPLPSPDDVAAVVPATERVTKVLRDRIVVDYVPWDLIRWDFTAETPEDIRWVAQLTKVPVWEVRDNPVYREYVRTNYGRKGLKALEDVKPDSTIKRRKAPPQVLRAQREQQEETLDDRVTLVEFWDFESGVVTTFVEQLEDLILYERPNLLMVHDDLEDRNPFVPLVLRTDPKNVRGVSDMSIIIPSLDELNEYRSNLATYIARTIPKIIGPAGALTEAGKRALQSREWAEYVELEGSVSANEIRDLQPPPLPQEVFDVADKIEQSIWEATGANELIRGLFPDRRRTATETATVVEQANIRQAEKRTRLERFYIDIGRRILTLMQRTYDVPRFSRIVDLDDPEFADVVWEWDAESIAGEMHIDVNLTPKDVPSRAEERDVALAALNLGAPMPWVDVRELFMWALEKMGVPRDLVRRFVKTDAEMQQEAMAQLQMQAQQQAVAAGEAPNPAGVPGPMAAEELASAVNPGTIPPEVAAALAGAGEASGTPEAMGE